MTASKGETIFELWHELKKTTDMANKAELPEIEMILRMTGDMLVQKYYSMGLPTRRDIHSLVWEHHEWPTTAATFLEMKSMLLSAKEAEMPLDTIEASGADYTPEQVKSALS